VTLVYDNHSEICEWASKGIFGNPSMFDRDCSAIGVMEDGRLIAGVIYNNYYPNISIEMSIYSVDKRWATRQNLRAFFHYPFIQLNLKRVTTLCSANEGDIIMFNQRLGFSKEGFHPEAHASGDDAISFGMLKKDCRWL